MPGPCKQSRQSRNIFLANHCGRILFFICSKGDYLGHFRKSRVVKTSLRDGRKRRQTAGKPGSVPPGLPDGDGHSSGTSVTGRLARPTRAAVRKPTQLMILHEKSKACRPYLVLLPVGFALPRPLPAARCALTAPFHPYRPRMSGIGGIFSVALSLGSPPPGVTRHRVSVEPGLSSPGGGEAGRWQPSGRLAPQR